MSVEKILFPTKFRELAFSSLESLLVLKDAGLKEIILLHVISREEVGFVPYGGYMKEEEEKRREEARIRFEDWQKTLSDKGIGSKIIIVVGEIVHEILEIAEKEKADLIVVGRKKKIGEEGIFTGSHTLQIITRSKIPTLVSKYMVQYKWNDAILTKVNDRIFDMPVFATGLSERAEQAMKFLISLKDVVKKMLVFHNIDVKIPKKHDKSLVCSEEEECKKRLEVYCRELKSAGIDAEPHLGAGDTLEEILRFSRERNASMIIMGTSGRGRLDELLHGSVSHEVAKMSELPTLLIP